MTENEAIEELKYDCNEIGKAIPCDTSWGESFENAYAMAINALEEVQQYRQIGTVEECRDLKDRLVAKKVSLRHVREFDGFDDGKCPTCGELVSRDFGGTDIFCSECGQKLDWSGEE